MRRVFDEIAPAGLAPSAYATFAREVNANVDRRVRRAVDHPVERELHRIQSAVFNAIFATALQHVNAEQAATRR